MIAGTLEVQFYANMARIAKDMHDAKGIVGGAMASIEKSVGTAKAALAALGIGLSAGYFVALIKGSIDAADHLDELTKSTSLAVETLIGLRFASKQSGGDLDSIAASISKLAVNMGKDAEKFAKLGVSAKDPLEAFKQLADVFVAIRDPQLRAAVMAEALGKSWAGAAPLMAEGGRRIGEMVEKGSALSRMTQETAAQAGIFNDRMEELKASGGAVMTAFLNPLLPQLNAIAKAMAETAAESGLLKAALVGLGGAIVGVFSDQLLSRPQKIAKDMNQLRDMLDAELSTPKWLLWSEAQKAKHQQQITAINESMLALNKELSAIQAVEAAEKSKTTTQTEAQKKVEEEARKLYGQRLEAAKAYEALQKKAAEYIKTLEKETAQIGLSVVQKKMVEASLIALTLRTEAERMAVMRAAAAWADATRIEADAAAVKKFLAEAIESANKALDDHAAKLGAEVAAAERALELYGLTKTQIEELTLARLEENLAIEQARDADAATIAYYEKEIDARKRIRAAMAGVEARDVAKKAAEESARAWDKAADDISRALTDALMRGFDDGKPFAQNFLDSLQATFKTAVLKIAVQMVMDPISGSLKGVLGGVGGAGGLFGNSGSITDTLSAGGSLYNLFTGNVGGGLYGAFATSSVGASLGLSTPGLMGPTLTGEALSGLTSLGTALPYVGLGLGALSMLGMFDGDGPTERSASVVQWGNVNGYAGEYGHNSAIGGFTPWANNQWFSGDMWPAQKAFGDQLVAIDNKIAAAITPAQLAAVQAALQADAPTSVGFGTEHTDWRSSGADEFIMTERYQIILNALQAGLGDLAAQGGITADEVENVVAGLNAAKQAEVEATAAQLDSQKKIAEGWQRVADDILQTIARLRGEIGGPQGSFAQAQAEFLIATAAARAGDQGAAGMLPALAQAVVELGRAVSTTSTEQAMLTARTIASLQGTVAGMARFGITVPAFDVGTNYVPRDMFARLHEGESVTPKRYNPAAGGAGTTELIAEIRELRHEVAGLRTAAAATASSTRSLDTTLTRVTRAGDSLVTTPA